MRKIKVDKITEKVKDLVFEANFNLPQPVKALLQNAQRKASGREKWVLGKILENASVARKKKIPLCQDTGLPIIFLEIGQEIELTNGSIEEAVWQGVKAGYRDGCLRRSVVLNPLERGKTDFVPSPIHQKVIPGDKLKIVLLVKGFGSENVSHTVMLNPTSSLSDIEGEVVNLVKEKGVNACPPLFIGLGIGGTLEEAVLTSKTILIRRLGKVSRERNIKHLEKSILASVNKLGIGAGAWGGRFTALAVKAGLLPTHIAGLPLAVNLSCHSLRWAKTEI